MLFCRDCGQCNHISGANFQACQNTSGYQFVDIDCVNQEIMDYGDSEVTDTGALQDITCPECSGQDIDSDWSGSSEEAFLLREEYAGVQDKKRKDRAKKLAESIKWDE